MDVLQRAVLHITLVALLALVGTSAASACLVSLASPTDPPDPADGSTEDRTDGAVGRCGQLAPLTPCPLTGCEGAACEPEIFGVQESNKLGALAVDGCDVFVTSGVAIYRFDKSGRPGSPPSASFRTANSITDVAIDDTYVFFTSDKGVHRIERDFSGTAITLALVAAERLVLDDSMVYFERHQSEPGPCIFSVNKDASQVTPTELAVGAYCQGLAAEGGQIFFSTGFPDHSLYAVDSEGGSKVVLSRGSTVGANQAWIAANEGSVAWTQPHAVYTYDRAAKSMGPEWPFVGEEQPHDIVIDRAPPPLTVFITNQGEGATIVRLVEGSLSNIFPVAANAGTTPRRIALDATHVYWTSNDGYLRRAPRCSQ